MALLRSLSEGMCVERQARLGGAGRGGVEREGAALRWDASSIAERQLRERVTSVLVW